MTFIPAKWQTIAHRERVDWIVVHTMEVPCVSGMAARISQRFALGERKVSAHYCVDPAEVVQCVLDTNVAWHCPGANRRGIGIEHAGYSQGPHATDWFQDEHALAMLDLSARLVADLCDRWDIPIVHPTPAEISEGKRGIIGHDDATEAFRTTGGHTDPGKDWPWGAFMAKIVNRVCTP
jgi:N-acetyl-anhydromuramyl-L-alanine amidase AmpD